jgi:hypothetical protein
LPPAGAAAVLTSGSKPSELFAAFFFDFSGVDDRANDGAEHHDRYSSSWVRHLVVAT